MAAANFSAGAAYHSTTGGPTPHGLDWARPAEANVGAIAMGGPLDAPELISTGGGRSCSFADGGAMEISSTCRDRGLLS